MMIIHENVRILILTLGNGYPCNVYTMHSHTHAQCISGSCVVLDTLETGVCRLEYEHGANLNNIEHYLIYTDTNYNYIEWNKSQNIFTHEKILWLVFWAVVNCAHYMSTIQSIHHLSSHNMPY